MPHSGGGGSHGGGFHGGSGYHGSSSGASARKAGSTNFTGATRYVFYAGYRPHYVYANYDITKKPKAPLWTNFFWLIPVVLVPWFMIILILNDKPEKLSTDYITGYGVQDEIGIIEDESEILNRMDEFYELTGITPVFLTVYDEDWNDKYKKLEKYAYEVYLRSFSDEKHMLIVYSVPEDSDSVFEDWKWELMQGNETDDILTEGVGERFGKAFQKNLTNNRVSVEDALVAAFDEIIPGIMDNPGKQLGNIISAIVFGMIWDAVFIAVGVGTIIDQYGKKAKQYQTAMNCPETVVEETCAYCDGIYVVGTCLSCPHCGAQLTPHSYPKKEEAKGTV